VSTIPGLVEHRPEPTPRAALEREIRETVHTCLQFADIGWERCAVGADLTTRLLMQLLEERGCLPPEATSSRR
jgi:hypothetical protein